MSKRIDELSAQIRQLEKELKDEIKKIRIQTYEIREKGIHFTEEIRARHREQVTHLGQYLRRSKLKHLLTAPVIWLCIFPAVFLDLIVSLFQGVCFPVYGIPKVKRGDYIMFDRKHLAYLNLIERANCLYCGYFNGLMAYVTEVAGRTEQYWCPIKHAQALKIEHSRYRKFAAFGDSEDYKKRAPTLRRDFGDIDNPES